MATIRAGLRSTIWARHLTSAARTKSSPSAVSEPISSPAFRLANLLGLAEGGCLDQITNLLIKIMTKSNTPNPINSGLPERVFNGNILTASEFVRDFSMHDTLHRAFLFLDGNGKINSGVMPLWMWNALPIYIH